MVSLYLSFVGQALFVNLRDGRSLPFEVSDGFTLEEVEDGFISKGGFLALPDGKQLWVNPHEILTAYLVPMVEGQRIALR